VGVETRGSATLCGPARGAEVAGTVNDAAVPTEALTPAMFSLAVARSMATDPVLSGAVERSGPPPIWRHPEGLAEAIVAGTLVVAERRSRSGHRDAGVVGLAGPPDLGCAGRVRRAVAARFLWHAYLSKRGRRPGGPA
jgi:hypothetical protein